MLAEPVNRVVDHPCINHRSMHMTLTYARIADRTVADEYAAVSTQIDALYGQQLAIAETGAMTRLRREAHARILGNGLCTRPVELECRMESAYETPRLFATGPSSSRSCYASEITPATTTSSTAPPSSTTS